VYVHGICHHESGYSDGWWNALQRHLPASIQAELAANRHEVLWSDHVTRASRSTDLEATVEERRHLEMLVEAVLQERAVKEAEEQLATAGEAEDGSRSLEDTEPVPRAMLGIPGLNCVDDFVKYLTISRIRQAVIEEFTRKVRGPLAQGHSVEVV
jgi:metacaspase-1